MAETMAVIIPIPMTVLPRIDAIAAAMLGDRTLKRLEVNRERVIQLLLFEGIEKLEEKLKLIHLGED